MSLRISILGAIALAGQSVSANWGIGWCDPFGPETKKDFEIERYAGNWYNIKYEKGYVGGDGDSECGTASYIYKKDEWWNPWPVEIWNRDKNAPSGESFFGLPMA